MGFRDDLAASKQRVRLLEKENAELRAALESSREPEPAPPARLAPSAAEYVAAAFITITPSIGFYASMVWWLPLTQPSEDSGTAGFVGALAAAVTSLWFLCPAVLGWSREDGDWARPKPLERVAAAAKGVGFIVFLALIFLFTDGDGGF